MIFSSKSKSELALLLDVQSSVVRGVLVNFKSQTNPTFIFTYSVPVPFKPHTNSGYLVKVTLQAINEVVESVLKKLSLMKSDGSLGELPSMISHVHFILSSPWIVSQAKTLKLSFPKKIKVTPESLHPYLEEERQKLTGNDADQLAVIEEKVFDVRLNGYSVLNWQGMNVKDLEISLVISVAGTKLITSFKDIANKVVSINKIFFHSSLLLQNIGVQKVLVTRDDYSLIHVHGEVTDIGIIHNHSCIFFGSYPLGINSLIRKIAHAANTDLRAAESLLSIYLNNHLDPGHSASAYKIIAGISQQWMKELLKLIETPYIATSSLDEVIISAHSHDNYFIEIFKKLRPQSKVTLLSIEDIKPHVNFFPATEKLRIIGLCSIAIHSQIVG